MPLMSDEEIETLARRRAGAKLGWYVHLAVYVVVNAAMFCWSRYGYSQRPWSMAPLLGWGVGVVLHGVSVFVLGKGSPWRERMVQRERDRLRRDRDRTGGP